MPLALSYPEAELLYVMNNSVCTGNPLCYGISLSDCENVLSTF